jgi:2-polyprenyl-3-methyl-5-hydroxy-6-metoxy-1,4-benzoquinol methylase
MSFQALRKLEQVRHARTELDRRGWSYKNGPIRQFLWRASRGRYPRVGDALKSWDVLETARFAAERLSPDDAITDFGAYSSELPLTLAKAGFREISGIDLNPYVRHMPMADRINYVVGSFHEAPFQSGTQSMITAISVIEHGYAPEKMLREVSRLLRPGGYFLASFDFWPQKIDTQGTKIFGLDWLIFSTADVRQLLDDASRFGLMPVGALDFSVEERPVKFGSFDYTFGWLALQKRI